LLSGRSSFLVAHGPGLYTVTLRMCVVGCIAKPLL
jgi:hypothetical protein